LSNFQNFKFSNLQIPTPTHPLTVEGVLRKGHPFEKSKFSILRIYTSPNFQIAEFSHFQIVELPHFQIISFSNFQIAFIYFHVIDTPLSGGVI